jgi:hypothetical protein
MGACDGFGSANWDALRTVAPPGAVGLEPLIWSNSVAPVSVRLIGLRRVGSEPSVDRIWLVAEAAAGGTWRKDAPAIRQTAEGTVTEE